ncbi:unnamed protein product, partial [Discosporangium mesarthrocarpum]
MTLVRSNPGNSVGFLADARRLNVAVTRARRHVAIVCDVECCGSDPFIGRLLRHVEDRGDYRSALELEMEAGPVGEDRDTTPRSEPVVVATASALGQVPPLAEGEGGAAGVAVGQAAAATDLVRVMGRVKGGGGGKGRRRPRGELMDSDVLAMVEAFARGGDVGVGNGAGGAGDELILPKVVHARQRLLVHEAAERLGIGHISQGDGEERRLVLTRWSASTEGHGARR